MAFPDPSLLDYVYNTAPPLHPDWLAYEQQAPRRRVLPVRERQPVYAQECRDLNARMMAPGARDHHLSRGIEKRELTIPSSKDGFQMPVLQLDCTGDRGGEPDTVVIYYHGGGLCVGEADSEELSCRRLVKSGVGRVRVYSIGYRLMPTYPASVCLSDCLDGFNAFQATAPKVILVGSSSGGQMAAAVSQMAPRGRIAGILLRCPVTADALSGEAYVPPQLRAYHTSASPSFVTSLGGFLQRSEPRDGLARLPLEAAAEELRGLPPTWVQLCTNDTLFSDGLCYAMLLRGAGVEVEVQLQTGWPHTFWLKAPELDAALDAEMTMVDGFAWLVGR